MGNCCSGLLGKGTDVYQKYGGGSSPGAKGMPSEERMVATWKQTGIVGLRDRALKELPESVQLVGDDAKVLDATGNKLSNIPTSLGKLVNLQRLILSNNTLLAIPGSVLVSLADTLKVLVLDGNLLTALPDEIGSLLRLEKLSAKNNSLAELNPCVGKLKALQFLSISHNKLEALPAELEGCDVLEELDASDNMLGAVTPALGALQKLKSLTLDNNRLTQVPQEIFLNCASLQTLSLHGCPVVPDSIQETEGFQVFEKRRREKYNKVIAGGVLMGSRGLDEGMDRKTTK